MVCAHMHRGVGEMSELSLFYYLIKLKEFSLALPSAQATVVKEPHRPSAHSSAVSHFTSGFLMYYYHPGLPAFVLHSCQHPPAVLFPWKLQLFSVA